jgi:hypothetical protein
MHDAFINAFYTQHVEGNRVDRNFTTAAYDNFL